MLSKVYSGHSFYHACRYIVNKPGAEVLEYEGVRGHDYKLMADDFMMQQQLHPTKGRACFHCSLSFYPGEVLSNDVMATIAKEYLDKLGMVNTQFAITKHTDRKHIHLHVVANMVNNNGEIISDSYLGLRGKKISQQLTKQYNLVPAEKKNIELTNHEALRKSEANMYKIYSAIMDVLPRCKTMNDLERRLQVHGIDIQYKYKGQTSERQGISFKIGDDCFKGSKIDRQFSLANLEKSLALQQDVQLNLNEKSKATQVNESSRSFHPQEHTTSSEPGKSLERIAEVLLKPEENFAQTPHELSNKNKRKRKKQSRRL